MTKGLLILRGCYDGCLGYSAHLRSHLRLLDRIKASYRLINEPLDPDQLDTDEIRKWRRLEWRGPPPGGSVVIQMLEPFRIAPIPNVYNIAYCMWEVQGFPNASHSEDPEFAWVWQLNQFEEIWTGSDFSKKQMVDAGVRVPVNIVPWTISAIDGVESAEFSMIEIPFFKKNRYSHPIFRVARKAFMSMPKSIRSIFLGLGFAFAEVVRFFARASFAAHLQGRRTSIQKSEGTFTLIYTNKFVEHKNLKDLVLCFGWTFSSTDPVRLLIKTSHSISAFWKKWQVLNELAVWATSMQNPDGPKLYAMVEPLVDKKYLSFLSIGDVFVNTSKGEGVGGGLLQSMALGRTAVTHLFSSVAEYCNDKNSFIFDYSLEPCSCDENFFGYRSLRARPDLMSMSRAMRLAFETWRSDQTKWARMKAEARNSALSFGDEQRVAEAYRVSLDRLGSSR